MYFVFVLFIAVQCINIGAWSNQGLNHKGHVTQAKRSTYNSACIFVCLTTLLYIQPNILTLSCGLMFTLSVNCLDDMVFKNSYEYQYVVLQSSVDMCFPEYCFKPLSCETFPSPKNLQLPPPKICPTFTRWSRLV